jgi:predicted DCC family thiol-disulfide oxidoreductase YuxK
MKDPRQVAAPPEKPVMIYDGDCAFCTRWIARWKRRTGDAVDYAPAKDAAARFPEIQASDYEKAVQLVEPDGKVSQGAEAALRSLAAAGRIRWVLRMYQSVPGFAAAAEWVYGFVARHRGSF